MSDSGQSSTCEEADYHLSALTVGQFVEKIEEDGGKLWLLDVTVRSGHKTMPLQLWSVDTQLMNEDMTLEGYIDNEIAVANNERRTRRRRSYSPVRDDGAFTLTARIVKEGNIHQQLIVEYQPAAGFMYQHRG